MNIRPKFRRLDIIENRVFRSTLETWFCLILLTGLTIACSEEPVEITHPSQPGHTHEHRHDHHAHIIPLTENSDISLEFLSSGKRNQLEVLVLDSHTHQPHAIDSKMIQAVFDASGQEIPVEFVAAPQSKDPAPKSSRFVIPFEKVPQQLKLLKHFQVSFSLNINGQSVTGTLDHKDDHQHHE